MVTIYKQPQKIKKSDSTIVISRDGNFKKTFHQSFIYVQKNLSANIIFYYENA